MKYRSVFLSVLTVFFSQLLFAQTAGINRPNVVLIIADDIGWGDIGCYGNKDVKTPNIDALSSSGLVFNNMYVTTSSGSPSRCSIISGRYPHNTGAPELHDPLPPQQFMFPEKLRSAGYYTALSGKNHMGPVVKKAFEMISPGKGPGAEEDWVTVLRDRPKDKPFFLWFASNDAHRDWQFNDKAPRYDPEKLVVPPMLYDGMKTRKDLASYYHEISRFDYYVGNVIAELKRQGIYENTYIMVMSDNGSPFPRNKARLYDSGIKTPFVLAGPGVKAARIQSLLSAVDIAPTVLDIAGVSKDQRIQGKSFFAILNGKERSTRDFVFAEHNWHVFQSYERMVRYGDWVYIRNGFPERQNLSGESAKNFPAGTELWNAYEEGLLNDRQKDVFLKPRPAEELYNLSADPFQFTNVAAADRNKKILLYLRKVLDTWIEETGDSKPKNPTPDRDNAEGKPLPGEWKKGEKPGEINKSSSINLPGPIIEKDIKITKN